MYTNECNCLVNTNKEIKNRIKNQSHSGRKTRASRTTGVKGSNFFARNSRLQITDDHMEDQIASIS